MLNLSVCGGEVNDIDTAGSGHTLGELNQIDCMVEFVSEIMLDQKNSFKESGAHNNSGNHSLVLKHFHLTLFSPGYAIKIPAPLCSSVLRVPLREEYNYLFLKEVIPHPPKLFCPVYKPAAGLNRTLQPGLY